MPRRKVTEQDDFIWQEVERIQREEAEKLWREVSEIIGKPCPIPVHRLKGMTRYTAIKQIELDALSVLDHPGTPEYEDLMSHIMEMEANGHMLTFRQWLEKEAHE